MDIDLLRTALNRLIPPDIVIRNIAEVDLSFHARVNAQSRTYWYFIWNSPLRSAFLQRYAWQIPAPLDITAMRQAAGCLIGMHDFASFQGADRENGHAVRDVTSVQFKKTREQLVIFSITGSSFVKHMVRNIVGTLVDVGLGKISADDFNAILQQKDRTLAGMTAPPQGLFLKKVTY